MSSFLIPIGIVSVLFAIAALYTAYVVMIVQKINNEPLALLLSFSPIFISAVIFFRYTLMMRGLL